MLIYRLSIVNQNFEKDQLFDRIQEHFENLFN
jgi:hypothetical protein